MYHKNSKKQKKVGRNSSFSPLSIIIIVILAVLLAVSGYFNCRYYFKNKTLKNIIIQNDREIQMAKKYISGNIATVGTNYITLEYSSLGNKKININTQTIITKVPMSTKPLPINSLKIQPQRIAISDLKKGDLVSIKLTGTIDDQNLIAKTINVISQINQH